MGKFWVIVHYASIKLIKLKSEFKRVSSNSFKTGGWGGGGGEGERKRRKGKKKLKNYI